MDLNKGPDETEKMQQRKFAQPVARPHQLNKTCWEEQTTPCVKNTQGMEVLMFRGKNNFCKVSPAYPQWLTVTEHWAPAQAADLPAWTAGMGPHEACSFLVHAARALMRPCLIIGIISFLYESLMQFYRMEVRWEGSSSWQLNSGFLL